MYMTPNRIMPTAITMMKTAPKLRCTSGDRRITGGRRRNWLITKAMNPLNAIRLSVLISLDSNQRSRWPSSSTTVNPPKPAVSP